MTALLRRAQKGTRPKKRQGLEAVEVSIRRVRLLAAVLLVGTVFSSRSGFGEWGITAWAALVGLPAALLVANWVSQVQPADPSKSHRSIVAQLAIDIAVTVGAIILIDPAAGSYVLMLAGLPVLHGALRYRLTGAFVVWLAVSAGLVLRIIVQWQPGSGLAPFVDMVVPLAIALAAAIPAGHLADQLTDEVLRLRDQRERSTERARLLAVLSVAGQELTNRSPSHVAQSTVHAAIEIGFIAAAIVDLTADGPVVRVTTSNAPPVSTTSLHTSWSVGDSTATDGDCWIVGLADDRSLALIVWAERGVHPDQLQIDTLHMLSTNAASSLANATGFQEIEAATRQLEYDATHDHLTGLLNRAGLQAAFANRCSPIGFMPFAVFLLDLDGFKLVNDSLGHAAGDQVLVATARRLAAFGGAAIDTSRLGGDEFVVLQSLHTASPIQLLAEIQQALGSPYSIDGRELDVGVSIGLATVLQPDASFEEAVRTADTAMYTAKRRTTQASQPSYLPLTERSATSGEQQEQTTSDGGTSWTTNAVSAERP